MTNQQIADVFDLLSKLMDIHGENSFKTKTYSTAAYKIEKLPEQLSEMETARILSIAGIGEAVAQKINTVKETGKLPLLEEYILKTPPGVIEMLSLKGIGPKKIALLWKELGLESIGELEYACNENRLITLKGFGAKTQDGILKNITFLRNNQGFYLWAEAEAYAEQVLADIRKAFPDHKTEFTGDYRRQLPALSAISYLTDLDETSLRSHFGAIPGAVSDSGDEGLVVKIPDMPALRFITCATGDFYTTLFTSTASPQFAAAFAEKYTLPQAPASEEAIFAHNQLSYIVPAMREQAPVLEQAANHTLPDLIQPADIKGIIHSHSTWSDGVNTLEQMAVAARDKGYEYLVISDHSQAAFYANGLSPERIAQQHIEIDHLNEKLAPFRIFKSIEADILHDGSLDYNESVLGTFDLVIASVHSNLKMNEEKAMQRLIAAITNPFTRILGHPTGRLLLSREGYPVDHKTLIDACVAHKVVIEINAHPRRLDLDWSWIPYALEQGAMLSVNPDAHSINGMDLVKYGVYAAQKGGLTAARNLSSMSLTALEAFIKTAR
ncbi:helix-hairpin-helix domain-containing protein [Taibaiella chishuiensis]|uniref:DNA polymerase (Family 10) n=1 Tax=Taibaiella chishuiensis TaxID=1434707 RepID=A0A2P8DB41_9BACT|nr:helix-hairpin-helix domain-containing protein [Taibaiella chishuiensis]PSK94421.1 DNA polymerase (family 10) [Taibaiella chishuiensis]